MRLIVSVFSYENEWEVLCLSIIYWVGHVKMAYTPGSFL